MGRHQAVTYFVYMVECADGTLYTGIATDVAKRIVEHNTSPRGAKYTRSRRPVSLLYSEEFPDRATASAAEYQIKKLPRAEKIRLANC